ncbi:hypothetical protein GYB57_12280 [bacterium]|nr:hypothetical protein [bacterium]
MKYIVFLICTFTSVEIFSQNILFPDTLFKNRLISNGIDSNLDGEISLIEASNINSLDISYGWNFMPINDLTGLEHFVNLDSLYCSSNNISIIPISNLIEIKYLNCSYNNISTLKLFNNFKIRYLDASGNDMDSLIFGQNDSLREIHLNSVNTDSIFDFSSLSNLETLVFPSAKDLNLSNNQRLKYLDCSYSSGKIDVSNNPELEFLSCKGQSTLDIRNSPKLTYLKCIGNANKLDSIDLSNNVDLIRLDLWMNNISNIDLSSNTLLQHVELGYNSLINIDFTNNNKITYLSCGGPNLRNIDITGLTLLESLATGNFLDSNSSSIDSLNLSTNFNLKHLYCPSGNLTKLDVSNNQLLEDIHCGFNNIDSLILCNNPNLNYLHFDGMPQLTNVFVPNLGSTPNYYDFGSPNWQFYNCNLVSVTESKELSSIQVFPNPASDYLKIDGVNISEDYTFEIINLNSEIVLNGQFSNGLINIEELRPSLYIFKIKKNGIDLIQKKIIKK